MDHPVVSREAWTAAREALLAREKTFTRERDRLSAARRALPWVRVDKPYRFAGPDGAETLAELFGGRSQLIVYHFMFGPDWAEGCPGCSLLADTIDGAAVHLAQRDVTLLAVSRAPLARIAPFQRRMGWRFKWVSSHASDFNVDFGVSFTEADRAAGTVRYNFAEQPFVSDELSGLSVFYRDRSGAVFHTYSSYGRGGDLLIGVYNYLDLVPKGRDEAGLAFGMAWVRHHDRYAAGQAVDPAATGGPPPG